jgi:Domain of unknown function (DUF1906)
MITILDTNRNVTAKLPLLNQLGIADIGRYLGMGLEAEEKIIKPAEARAIGAAGLRLFLIYEIGAKTAAGGAALGARDGKYALAYAKTLGMPQDSSIFPAADFDAQGSDYPAISAYMKAFGAAVSPYLRLGIYANGYTCNRLKADGLIELRWLTCSKGFLGTRDAIASGAYEILQALPTPVAGLDSDPDTLHVANGDFGSRVPFAPLPPAPAAPPAVAVHPSISPVSLLARIEKEFGLS